jgi:hypothetical protein
MRWQPLDAVGCGARGTFVENFDSTYYFFENHDKLNRKKPNSSGLSKFDPLHKVIEG